MFFQRIGHCEQARIFLCCRQSGEGARGGAGLLRELRHLIEQNHGRHSIPSRPAEKREILSVVSVNPAIPMHHSGLLVSELLVAGGAIMAETFEHGIHGGWIRGVAQCLSQGIRDGLALGQMCAEFRRTI
jgi:hypothetical protein